MVDLDHLCFSKEEAYTYEIMKYYFSLPSSSGLGYFWKEKLIAFILFQKNHIITLDVHPEHRRKGFGEKLLNFAITYIKKKGHKLVSLEVDVENKKAINLYKKLNFKFERVFLENKKERFFMVLKLY